MHCFSCNTTLCFLNRFCLLATAQLKNQMTKKGSRRSDFSSARKKTSLEKGPDRMRTSWDNHQMGQKITRSASLALQHQFFFFRYSASMVPFGTHVQVQVLVQYLSYRANADRYPIPPTKRLPGCRRRDGVSLSTNQGETISLARTSASASFPDSGKMSKLPSPSCLNKGEEDCNQTMLYIPTGGR